MATQQRQRITEMVTQPGQLRVDREAGVIYGVKALGVVSRKGRKYSEAALRQAAQMYEGVAVNVDHKYDGERLLCEGFGELRNPVVKSDGVYADLHYLKAHPIAESVAERAERFPHTFGMSHDADGNMAKDGAGEWVVESLEKVHSVDLVATPATTQGLFESSKPMKRRKVTEAVKAAKRHALAQIIARVMEGEDETLPTVSSDLEYEVQEMDGGAEPTADQHLDMAFRAMVMDILDGEGESGEKLKKLKAVLGLKDDAAAVVSGEGDAPAATPEAEGEGGDAEEDPKDDEEKKAMESLRKDVERLKALVEGNTVREAIDGLLESAGASRAQLTEPQRKLLDACKDAEHAKDLIESWDLRAPRSRKVTSGGLHESAAVGSYDEEAKRGSLVTRGGYFSRA